MSQVIAIRFSEMPDGILDAFLRQWSESGSSGLIADQCYELSQGHGEDPLLLCLSTDDSELVFEGYTSDDSWKIIDDFSRAHGGMIYHEGEPLDSGDMHEGVSKPTLLGAIASIGLLIGMILVTPLMILYAGLRIICSLVLRRD